MIIRPPTQQQSDSTQIIKCSKYYLKFYIDFNRQSVNAVKDVLIKLYIKNIMLHFWGLTINLLKFGAKHFIYYTNRSITTKVDSTYLGY